jgi:hypothetical protein
MLGAGSALPVQDLDRDLELELFFRDLELFLRGTLAPFFRASERAMAIACLRLFTLPPRPPLPLRSVPRFRRRIALSTLLLAPLLYFLRLDLREDDFFAAMRSSIEYRVKRT